MATTGAPSVDWQSGKTLSECFNHLLTSGIASDVTFLVGKDKKRISAHKLVLISRSPVFYAMFEGPMAEKGEVTIPDVSEDTFLLFLRYLYTDTVDFTEKNTVPVLSVARKYCVDILVARCEEFLKQTLSPDNACLFLELANEFVMENLKTKSLQFIADNPGKILHSRSFAGLSPSYVASITESDDLQTDEIDVYSAIMRWAEAECRRQNLEVTSDNKREVLGNILYTVRFPVMDYDFFQRTVCHDKVLPGEDVIQTINYQHHRERVLGSKLNHDLRATQRLWRVEGAKEGFADPGMVSVSFTVSNSVSLLGFGSFYTFSDDTVDVVIYENTEVVYQADNISRVQSETSHIGEVLLKGKDSIHLKAGNVYTISENTSDCRHYRGLQTLSNTLQFKKTTIEFRDCPVTLSNVRGHNGCQIPYLLLRGSKHEKYCGIENIHGVVTPVSNPVYKY